MKRTALLILAVSVFFMAAGLCVAEDVFTPPVGSAERKAILNTLRVEIRDNFDLEVAFVVKWLKVKDGWAWVETEPQSCDGKNRYEPFLALLEKREGIWIIVEIPSLEEDSSPVDDDYFGRLLEKFPGLPGDIFPREK
ncbi:MAG: hypothetical protein Q7I97_09560 [Thermovirgaceae bacterium]|nr:hypothetical protein [Thermovirgaceae bacterium]